MAGSLPRAPFLYPIIDVPMVPLAAAVGALRTLGSLGIRMVQLRAKGLADGDLLRAARELAEVAGSVGVKLIVNDRADVARLSGAHGVHVGQGDLPAGEARRVMGAEALVGCSTHTAEQLRAACAQPIDYLAAGPIFPTTSKMGADPVVGLELLRHGRRLTDLPLVAIGGIVPSNVAAVIAAGADGVAVIGGLWGAASVGEAVRRFRDAVPGME